MPDHQSKKRKKRGSISEKDTEQHKKPCPDKSVPRKLGTPVPAQPTKSLMGPHETIVSELKPKYDVLAASVISSTQIRKRVTHTTKHLLASGDLPRVVLLHARPGEVCKLITIVEQCKRVLASNGQSWCQYNQLFDMPLIERTRKDVVEETVLDRASEDSDSDDFETMNSRFEKAIFPETRSYAHKSMRVFLSTGLIMELKSKDNITLQRSEKSTVDV